MKYSEWHASKEHIFCIYTTLNIIFVSNTSLLWSTLHDFIIIIIIIQEVQRPQGVSAALLIRQRLQQGSNTQHHNTSVPEWHTSSCHLKYGGEPLHFIRQHTAVTVTAHITARPGLRCVSHVCFLRFIYLFLIRGCSLIAVTARQGIIVLMWVQLEAVLVRNDVRRLR